MPSFTYTCNGFLPDVKKKAPIFIDEFRPAQRTLARVISVSCIVGISSDACFATRTRTLTGAGDTLAETPYDLARALSVSTMRKDP